jgi:hypothetical protein
MAFCDVVLGWDSNDQQYDNVTYTGWHTAFPDAPVRLLPETCRALPLEGDMLLFLGEFAGRAEAVCPRAVRCGACSSARRAWATAPQRPRQSTSSSCSMKHPASVREKALSRSHQHDARILRLLDAAQLACRQ